MNDDHTQVHAHMIDLDEPPVRPQTESSAADMVRALRSSERPPGSDATELQTGFATLDIALDGGLNAGDLCVIGGAPGVGKTILALQMARNMTAAGHRVLYCCYEHGIETLLGRLVAIEVGNQKDQTPVADATAVRAGIAEMMAGRWTPDSPGATHPLFQGAMAEVESYGDRLVLAELSTSKGTIEHIQHLAVDANGRYDAVYVDYLQKVGIPGAMSGTDRLMLAAEGLKNLALQEHCLVIAISALDQASLKARRVSLDGFRGADAIAHEADVAIVLNEKLKIVSRSHLAFDTTLYETFAKYTIVTVEKNRRGRVPVDTEFRKDFARFRFEPQGRFVDEQLIDDILTRE